AQNGVSSAELASHTAPHSWQWSTERFRLASQPSTRSSLQSSKPSSQLSEHTPSLQAGVPLRSEQTSPQTPQLTGSEVVSISQPSSVSLLQFWKPSQQATI